MIPLPPLDGGHIAGALFEGGRRQVARWRGRPNPGYADTAKLMPLTYAVFILFVGMGLLLAVADIVEPVVLT
jgi:membrane-associated protease RseP (regulator of RpoE activity)